jgi:hypothetical protein
VIEAESLNLDNCPKIEVIRAKGPAVFQTFLREPIPGNPSTRK